jgi:hypothetical protein
MSSLAIGGRVDCNFFPKREELMSRDGFRSKLWIALLLVVLMVFAGMGCSSTAKNTKAEASTGGEIASSSRGKYYHFEDVLVPAELNFKPDESFIYEAPRFKAGILIFTKWRLDVDSLIDFFNTYMEKDNWKMVNSFRGKESFLNFSKPDKTCSIKIIEKWTGTTKVEIRVGPLGEKKM